MVKAKCNGAARRAEGLYVTAFNIKATTALPCPDVQSDAESNGLLGCRLCQEKVQSGSWKV